MQSNSPICVFFSWNFDKCNAATGGGTTPATTPTTGTSKYFMHYTLQKCVYDGAGQGNAQSWDYLFLTLKECCQEKNWWNDKCEDT